MLWMADLVKNKSRPGAPSGFAYRLPEPAMREGVRHMAFWVGAIVVGVVALLFAKLADLAGALFTDILALGWWIPFLLAPAGLATSVLLTRGFFPGAQGSGIPQVIASLHMTDAARVDATLSPRIAVGKVILTLLGLLCGASIGREGPTVQVSATIMHSLGRRLRLTREDAYRAMVLGGGAAGIAAAFNTPLAGVVFAIEELSHSFEARTSGTVLTAVIISGITTAAAVGNYHYFGTTSGNLPWGWGWFAVPVCALLGGLGGGCFSALLLLFARGIPGRVGRSLRHHPVAFAAVCGLCLAILGTAAGGATYGTGYAQASGMVSGQHPQPLSFTLLKFLATVVSYISGIPGGIFAPSLAVGAGLGQAIAHVITAAPAGTVVLLGMVAYFSGVVQAPITATIIVMEMTNDGQVTVPLMATSLLAFAASRLVCRKPLYAALADYFLASADPNPPPGAPGAAA